MHSTSSYDTGIYKYQYDTAHLDTGIYKYQYDTIGILTL